MNDFLQSLRNGQAEKPRTPKTRKNYDNSYHYTSQPRFHSYGGGFQSNRNQQMKRPQPPAQQPNQAPAMDDATVTSMLAEAIEGLSRNIENMAKNQEYLLSVQERTADMLERQALAIERIVEHLNLAPAPETAPQAPAEIQPAEPYYVSSDAPVAKPVSSRKAAPAEKTVIRRRKIVTPKNVSASADNTNLLSRDAIMDIIRTMRAEGATYDQVASRLIDLGQPTFSGRGEWHAQTIHRLCSKK